MTRCGDIKREVPRTLMQDGINLCKKNILEYLNDSLIILEQKRFSHALISAEFALEELGKLLLLRENLRNTKTDFIIIDGKEFCSHDKKVNRALNFLDPKNEYHILFYEGFLAKGNADSGIWTEKITEIDSSTRLECAFVDFIDNKWVLGSEIDEGLLRRFIYHFAKKCSTLRGRRYDK